MAAVLGTAATVVPAAAAGDPVRAPVPGSADVLDPQLAAGSVLYLAGRRPVRAPSAAAVLVRSAAGWRRTDPGGPAPVVESTVIAGAAGAWSFGAALAAATRTTYDADGDATGTAEPLAGSAAAGAACQGGGVTRIGAATDGGRLGLAATTLPRAGDAALTPSLAIGVAAVSEQQPTWRCAASPVPVAGAPAIEPRTSAVVVPVVRIERGRARLFAVTAPSDVSAPVFEDELGQVAGLALSCGADEGNTGWLAYDGDGTRWAAAVANGARALHVWRGSELLELPAAGELVGAAMVASQDGVVVASLTAGAACSRDLHLTTIDADGARTERIATALAPGCSSRIGLAVQGPDVHVAVQTGTAGDCAASAATGRQVELMTTSRSGAAASGNGRGSRAIPSRRRRPSRSSRSAGAPPRSSASSDSATS